MPNKLLYFLLALLVCAPAWAADVPLGKESTSCVSCHEGLTPGVVGDWRQSRHARTTLSVALAKPETERRVSAEKVRAGLEHIAVGCFECHGLNTDKHADSFDHYGFRINVVVSPDDCATCHPQEAEQYSGSKKANAIGNLTKNPVYHTLVKTIISPKEVDGLEVSASEPSAYTRQEACFGCHGTEIKVKGMKEVKTSFGPIRVPDLSDWPNQGVGRINPDGSMGSCTSCHPRHGFDIKVARKAHTCAQCHLEPDVPAWNVYAESKHGNIFLSVGDQWDFDSVPWRLGRDFSAPTCPACHVSLVARPDGSVIAERSHDFGSRLWVRLFGLVYSHAQPKKGDTSIIKNKDGLPLPTTFAGEPASEYLLGPAEQAERKAKMTAVCRGCHSTSWVEAHFDKLDNALAETDSMTLAATKLLSRAWAKGIADGKNPFDEEIEQKWIKQWLFYANSVRYASAMTGAPDYIAFKYGWWGLTTNLEEMRDYIKTMETMEKEDE